MHTLQNKTWYMYTYILTLPTFEDRVAKPKKQKVKAQASPKPSNEEMHKYTMNIPRDLFVKAKIKAMVEGMSLSEVIRELLTEWIRDQKS